MQPVSSGWVHSFYRHYYVISIAAENVAEHITLQKIAELATLKDNIIAEMQFRSFLVSASYS